jgi:hypothetical protein
LSVPSGSIHTDGTHTAPAREADEARQGVLGVDEMLYRVFAENVGRYLDAVDGLAAAGPRPLAPEARRLVAAWRALLELHRPAGRRCAGCGRGRSMCGVWRVASAYFVRRLPGEPVSR